MGLSKYPKNAHVLYQHFSGVLLRPVEQRGSREEPPDVGPVERLQRPDNYNGQRRPSRIDVVAAEAEK